MANQTERDNQQVGIQTTSMRWRVCFTKTKGWASNELEDTETFTSRNAAVKFGNDLGRADFRRKYFGDPDTVAANVRIVEVGEYEKEVPWDEWCELSKSIDETIKELDAEKKPREWFKVWYKLHAGGSVQDVSVEYKTLDEAKKEANRIVKENRCYALSLARCGQLKTDVRIQTYCPECDSATFLPEEMWLEQPQKYVVPSEYQNSSMTFWVEHSRVPKPMNFHDEASPMFVTDKFTTFAAARNFAMHLLKGDGPAYVIETGKTHWFFNINIYAVENDHRKLVPQDQWCDDVYAKEQNELGIFAYCSEVAGIKGERDILREELKKANAEIASLKFAIRNELKNISGHISYEMDLMNKLLGDENNGNNA